MNIIKISVLLSTFLLLFMCFPLFGNVIHVSKSGTPNGSGDSWANAIDEFVQAIGIAQDGDTIFIAGGTYLLPFKDRLWITQNLHVYGGFAGWELSIDERILGDNITEIACNSYYSKIVVKDVKRYFLFDGIHFTDGFTYCPQCGDELPDSLFYVQYGGSILFSGLMDTLDIIVQNCVFRGNAAYSGGAMYLSVGAEVGSIKIKNCTFEDNYAWHDGYHGCLVIYANGIDQFVIELDSCTFYRNSTRLGFSSILINMLSNSHQDSVIISNCLFDQNAGGSYSFGTIGLERRSESMSHPYFLIDQCRFENNSYSTFISGESGLGGAAISTDNVPEVDILNSSFIGNRTNGFGMLAGLSFDVKNSLFANNYSKAGGTIYFDRSTYLRPLQKLTQFTNCTFANNQSEGPGTLFLKNGPFSHFEMNNCILYNNSSSYHPSMFFSRTADLTDVIPPQISSIGGDADPSLFHFNQELDSWILNTDELTWFNGDPMFVDSLSNDFRLKRCSPYINKGSNAVVTEDLDIEGNVRILEDTVDLGAFERLSFMPELELLAATCAHNPDGEIRLLPGSYTAPVFWYITDGTGTLRENGKLSPGAYEALMLDGEDCGTKFDILIPGPDTINAVIAAKGAKPASSTGFLAIDSISGGVPEYEIKWSDGSSGYSTSGLLPGKYAVTITDEVGCERVWAINVPFNNHMPLPNAMGHLTILNPASNSIEYRWDPVDDQLVYAYSLINELGQEVASGLLLPGRQHIQLFTPSGYYWLIVSNAENRATYPLIFINH